MRLVLRTGPGVVEFNFMWAPAFIAYDNALKKHIEETLGPELVGQELTEGVLDTAHDRALDLICERHAALPGLRDYLDAIKFVQDR